MPRTKYVRKSKQEQQIVEECDLITRDFQRQLQLRISNLEADARMQIKSFETFADVTLHGYPKEIRLLTIGEILKVEHDSEKENCNEVSSSIDDFPSSIPPSAVKTKKTTKRNTAVSDDGYVTEGVATTRRSRVAKTATESTFTRRTRSSSRNSRIKYSEIHQGTVKKKNTKERMISAKADKFKTPGNLKPINNTYGLVTPKIKPNTPINVLRRPRQGEMVLSMQGSPLLVSAIVQEETANINVPLSNGNVISLLPNEGLRISHIPALDPETMQQLETLKSHIEKVIGSK